MSPRTIATRAVSCLSEQNIGPLVAIAKDSDYEMQGPVSHLLSCKSATTTGAMTVTWLRACSAQQVSLITSLTKWVGKYSISSGFSTEYFIW